MEEIASGQPFGGEGADAPRHFAASPQSATGSSEDPHWKL